MSARELNEELLSALRAHAQTSTEFMARLGGLIFNDTLDVFSALFPSPPDDPMIRRAYGVAIGAVVVDNQGAGVVTVNAGGPGPGGGPPPSGTGVYTIPANSLRTIAIAAREFTVWGTATQRVCFQVFTAPVRPGTA